MVANREASARYGVNVSDILEVVEVAIGGETVDQVFLNTRRFGIHVRLDERHRRDTKVIGNILVHTSDGFQVPLSQVAQIREVTGPIQINRENNQRRWIISANVRAGYGQRCCRCQKLVESKIDLPPDTIWNTRTV